MTLFEIISIIVILIGACGTVLNIYIKNKLAIAKIDLEIIEIKKDMLQYEADLKQLEKFNRDDHKEILVKIDKILEQNVKK
jgi:hypothetical protein